MRTPPAVRGFAPTVLPAGRLAGDLIRFGEAQWETDGESIRRFLSCLRVTDQPEANAGLFLLVRELLRGWAGIGDLTRCDADAIEAARKICDVMGWPPAEV